MWTRVAVSCVVVSTTAFAKPAQKLVVTQPMLEVLDPAGSVTKVRVQEALVKINGDLAKCGDDAKWTGEALVWLVTDWHGKVIKAQVAVEKPAVERCLVAGLKRLVVPKAQSRATTVMRLKIGPAQTGDPRDELE